MLFKDVLYNLRSRKGISQVQLAKDIGVSPGLIGMYESGKRMPSVEVQETLADYFNVSLDYLMGREQGSTYYLNPETAEMAQRIFDDPNLRALFDAADGSSPSDLKMAADMLQRFKETNTDG